MNPQLARSMAPKRTPGLAAAASTIAMQRRHALAGTYPAALACIVRPGAYACDGTVLVLAATAGSVLICR